MPLIDVVPCGILKLFGVSSDKCTRDASVYRSVTNEQRDAYGFYDGLVQNPDAELSFPLAEKRNGVETGRTTRKTFRVADLVKLSPDWRDRTVALERALARCSEYLAAINTDLSDADKAALLTGSAARVTQQTRNPLMADARLALDVPLARQPGTILDPYNPVDPRMVPSWYPKLVNRSYRNFTPAVLDRNRFPADKLQNDFDALVAAIDGYLQSRNVKGMFHPAIIAAQQNIQVQFQAYSNVNGESGSNAINTWYNDNRDPSYLIQNTVLNASWSKGSVETGGSSLWLWRESLARRFPITISTGTTLTKGVWDDGESRTTWNLYTADALLELLRYINVAQVLLSTGNASIDGRATMVDMFAMQAVYTGTQRAAYRQIGRPYGSNVQGFREQLQREATARAARARGDLGVPGYQSSGDDAADIAMGTIGTVGLAVADALRTGNIVAGVVSAVMRGVALLITFLDGPDAFKDPFAYPIRIAGGKSVNAFGVTVENALNTSPVIRVR